MDSAELIAAADLGIGNQPRRDAQRPSTQDFELVYSDALFGEALDAAASLA